MGYFSAQIGLDGRVEGEHNLCRTARIMGSPLSGGPFYHTPLKPLAPPSRKRLPFKGLRLRWKHDQATYL